MTIDKTFELSIPTHISCVLYKNDEIDNLLISIITKECRNYAMDSADVYSVKVNELVKAFQKRKELKELIEEVDKTINTQDFKPNSIYFLTNIIQRLENLKIITFVFSNDNNFTRILKYDTKSIISFNFTILEGIFDLTKILDRRDLDSFNKSLIQMSILPSKYLERRPYVYMKTDVLFHIIDAIEANKALEDTPMLDFIDPKLERDNPMLLIKTDYTIY
jgi:hypothetical protein